ncbi:LLM class F420-dependent oxidoreductase [Actinoallomurus purpureus]|uniref:LLM class F420-dependent oxidoreductase n=1 Tax=Actinoallomurus purpureus TaxID=478114 RepID=UPI002091EC7A|nr:LLM class F420-dependent oxidoreductase [Actinoallomurus purpureus]MCO6011588.1 LLM class F420-dependent oxidoreductase [Actinoallomurus purpureus]
MDLSVVIGNWSDRPAEEALHTAAIADRLRFGELWIGETDTWDAFALASAIGLATDQIAMTVGPLPVAVRDPAMIAMGAASVAALTRRRIGVALGTSSPRVVEEWHGRSWERSAAVLEESARAVRGLLAGKRVDLDGVAVRTHGFRLRLAPSDGPLSVAAFGDRAVRAAAEHADRMLIDMVSPRVAAELRAKLDAAAGETGRPAPRLVAWLPAAVDPTPESYAQLMWSIVPYLGLPGYAEAFTSVGLGDAVALARGGAEPRELLTALPFDVAGLVGLVGTADEVRSRLREYADAGVDEVAVAPATGGDPGGERTLTAIRGLIP